MDGVEICRPGLAWRVVGGCVFLAIFAADCSQTVRAQNFVPGSGRHLKEVGDDFEEEDWTFNFQWPKASSNLDSDSRYPIGESKNGRWYESAYRGEPDVCKVVATPPGGLPGSKGALLMQTLISGIPGQPSYKFQQDDLLVNVNTRLGGFLPVEWAPSCVVRVYLPPWERWEQRTGASFALRADVEGTKNKEHQRAGTFFTRGSTYTSREPEAYWPGMFIQFNSKRTTGQKEDSAIILIRGDHLGHEINGPVIKEPGWWTLGMSFSPDGQVHYYARPGVENLRPEDHLASTYPYSARAEKVHTFFFNIVNQDDGRTWSTPWVIDDMSIFILRRKP